MSITDSEMVRLIYMFLAQLCMSVAKSGHEGVNILFTCADSNQVIITLDFPQYCALLCFNQVPIVYLN